MSAIWLRWQSELESLSLFAEEWTGNLAETFLHDVEAITARKRAQKCAFERLAASLNALSGVHRKLLAFFDIEQGCLCWSPSNCPAEDLERVSVMLGEWINRLAGYTDKYPPGENRLRSLASLQIFLSEAQGDLDTVRGGFGALDAYLAPQAIGSTEAVTANCPGPVSDKSIGAGHGGTDN